MKKGPSPEGPASAASRIARLRESLSRLRSERSVSQTLNRTTYEVCRGCGFKRAVLFTVMDSEILPVGAHFEDDAPGAQRFLQDVSHRPRRVDSGQVEAEIMRKRKPILVDHVSGNGPKGHLLAAIRGATAFVAAPIFADGTVMGILVADQHQSGREVDIFDRDVLGAFAEGLGSVIERATLLERLGVQQEQLGVLAKMLVEVGSGSDGSVFDSVFEHQDAHIDRRAALANDGTAEPLTRREIEVLELISAGLSNGDVAGRLVIAESTVKSHVKQILRKLGAANRAEAVSRYLKASRGRSLRR